MSFFELLVTSVVLSMDAFSVAVCKGLGMRRFRLSYAAVIGLFFGGFQALMPLIGWFVGKQFAGMIEPVDHWISFLLLAFIGGKMLWDGLHGCDEGDPGVCDTMDVKGLFLLAIATSIDALTVGVTFSFLQVDILQAILLIGVITFALSFVGAYIGHKFGGRHRENAEVVGGAVLILIGLKVLLEHLGVFAG